MWKFRSMHVDAEARLEELRHRNEHDGVLFKMRDDPRVTPRRAAGCAATPSTSCRSWSTSCAARCRWSGPRPPLPSEVAQYDGHTRRRLLVKPGMTGLWQVSGRSDLSWEETVRLDLQYVENWSLGLDLVVLAKTVSVVLRGRGAYSRHR